MAISPNVLDQALTEEAEYFEKIIDRELLTKKNTGYKNYAVDVPRGMNHSHFTILEAKYIKAGWSKVEWNSDQREGEWLTFQK